MLDANTLEALKTAAASSDWSSAGEAFIELGLDADTAADRFIVEAIGQVLRLRDGKEVVAVVDQLVMNPDAYGSSKDFSS